VKKLVQQLLRLDDQAATLNIAVTAAVLRRGMKDDVRSQAERALENRCGKRIINEQ